MGMKLKFYDVKGKKTFTTDKYTVKGRIAHAKAPSGAKAVVFVKRK